jgi:hypothetical protein
MFSRGPDFGPLIHRQAATPSSGHQPDNAPIAPAAIPPTTSWRCRKKQQVKDHNEVAHKERPVFYVRGRRKIARSPPVREAKREEPPFGPNRRR